MTGFGLDLAGLSVQWGLSLYVVVQASSQQPLGVHTRNVSSCPPSRCVKLFASTWIFLYFSQDTNSARSKKMSSWGLFLFPGSALKRFDPVLPSRMALPPSLYTWWFVNIGPLLSLVSWSRHCVSLYNNVKYEWVFPAELLLWLRL